jgi:hypothetical protein
MVAVNTFTDPPGGLLFPAGAVEPPPQPTINRRKLNMNASRFIGTSGRRTGM